MQSGPLISVLMGIYNVESTLQEAVDCIIAQTYKNWELIMCDDCSTDNTYNLALSISKTDDRIKVIRNETNLTLAPTLNNCLALAKGYYVARMDGDDICDPTRFEKEVGFLQNNKDFVLVSSKMNLYDKDGVFRTTVVKDFPDKSDLLNGPPFCHAGCMIRTDVMRELNGYNVNKDVTRIEDYDLWFRLYRKGYKGANIQEALYSMRDDRNALKRRKFRYRVNSFMLIKKIIKEFNLPMLGYIKALRPICIGLLPTPIYRALHKR